MLLKMYSMYTKCSLFICGKFQVERLYSQDFLENPTALLVYIRVCICKMTVFFWKFSVFIKHRK